MYRRKEMLGYVFWGLWMSIGMSQETSQFEIAIQQLQHGQFAEAEILLKTIVEKTPKYTEAWWELGWAEWAQDDFQGSIDAWTKVEQIDPEWKHVKKWLEEARVRQSYNVPIFVADIIETTPVGKTFTIAAAGDTMMGTAVKKGEQGLPQGNGEELFVDVASIFTNVDVAFVNLEGPIADDHIPVTKCGPTSTACYAFRTPTRYVQALQNISLDLASLANNHAMDAGEIGLQSTMDILDSVGIAHAGKYGDVAIIERNGIKIGMLAAHSGLCCLNVNRIGEVTKAIQQLDKIVDVVILSFHGGAEGNNHRHVPGSLEIAWGEKRGDVKKLARAAIDAGADLVLGHGPHVLRAMEVYKERMIVYSLGNFMGYNQFGTQGGFGGTSMIVELEMSANGVLKTAKIHPILLDERSIPHLDESAMAIQQVQELSDIDFPDTGVLISKDGTITWNKHP